MLRVQKIPVRRNFPVSHNVCHKIQTPVQLLSLLSFFSVAFCDQMSVDSLISHIIRPSLILCVALKYQQSCNSFSGRSVFLQGLRSHGCPGSDHLCGGEQKIPPRCEVSGQPSGYWRLQSVFPPLLQPLFGPAAWRGLWRFLLPAQPVLCCFGSL